MKVLSLFLLSISCNLVASWTSLGSTIYPPSSGHAAFGSVVKISDNGRRAAVGSPDYNNGNGAVMIYEIDEATESTWNLIFFIQGESMEGIGSVLSLSPDGMQVAVSRDSASLNAVQVYQVLSSDAHIHQVGSDVSTCSSTAATSLSLSQSGPSYYLLVGCENDMDQRGLVRVYELGEENGHLNWISSLPVLLGDASGDHFGADAVLVPALSVHGDIFRIAVSAPKANSQRGLVRVFTGNGQEWEQLGDDLVGTQSGEQFGFSLAMSSTDQPYLVVGSPMKRLEGEYNPHGVVQLFHWRSLSFGDPSKWNIVGQPETGLGDRDLFGHSVAISRHGGRFVASSRTHDSQRGYFRVYERHTYENFQLVGNAEFGSNHWAELGASVSMNAAGSVILAGSPYTSSGDSHTGMAQIWVDESSFCQLPAVARASYDSVQKAYIDRAVCRDGLDIVWNSDECNQASIFVNGQLYSCQWESRSLLPTASPTSVPSFLPTLQDTLHPTRLPSFSAMPTPRVVTLEPSVKPSGNPTTNVPTGKFHDTASEIPSQGNDMATVFPSSSIPSMGVTSTYPTTEPTIAVTEIQACPCNVHGVCTSNPLDKGSELLICIYALSVGIEFSSINLLIMQQGDASSTLFDNGQAIGHGTSAQCENDSCVAIVSVPGAYFGESTLEVSGHVLLVNKMKWGLRGSADLPEHSLPFHTIVPLRPQSSVSSTEESSAVAMEETRGDHKIVWVLLAAIGSAALVLVGCCIRRRARHCKSALQGKGSLAICMTPNLPHLHQR